MKRRGASNAMKYMHSKTNVNITFKDHAVTLSLLLLGGLMIAWGLIPAERPQEQPALTPVSYSAAPTTEVVAQPIQTIRVGQRMWIGDNPSSERDERIGAEIHDPSQWRKMVLHCPKRDGSTARVEMLRPIAWLAERDVRAGGQVDIEVPECGIEGLAEVLEVQPCPVIQSGEGRVVTATFHHQAARTINVAIAGLEEPIGTTPNHPFWSETAQQFVRADQLSPGDEVRILHGTAVVTSITPRGPPEPVYNLEVQFEHVYRVGDAGVLVHNGNPCKVYHGTDSASADNIVSNGLDDAARRRAAGGAGVDDKGFSTTTDRATAEAWAQARAAERGGNPVVLEAAGDGLPLRPGRPGDWADPDELFIDPADFGEVGPGTFGPSGN